MGLFDVLLKLLNVVCGGQKAEPEPQPPIPLPEHQQPHRPPQHEAPAPHRPPHEHRPPRPHEEPHRPHHEPSPPPTHPGPPAHQPHHKSRKGVNENLENQRNPYYTDLRDRANAAGDAMARAFRESQEAYQAGDGARAKALSDEGKARRAEMDALNLEASDWIFKENNTDSEPGEIDLHGLYVKEAIRYADLSIQDARQRGDPEIRFIVGKGMHSKSGVGKLRPAIEELMQKHQLVPEIDPRNAGVLVVQLGGAPREGMGADEITRRLENDREECVIM
ncbi:DUF1771-domain-containing protein [Auricularia subglabra TFB-10046 SS5]|nr:DUF1771-domain-containing protein [Auricularia subglabra TFB-10046 SS5]